MNNQNQTSSTGPSSSMDSSLPSDSARSTKQDSSSWRDESCFLNSEKLSDSLPSLESVTETSSDPEEEETGLLLMELDARPFNNLQKRKFSRLRKRVWELECKTRGATWSLIKDHCRKIKETTTIAEISFLFSFIAMINVIYLWYQKH